MRLLTSPSTSFLSKPRSITTVTPSALRIPRQSTQLAFQRRWATSEAEAKSEDENTPISQLQPTPQEEVENAVHSDNAAEPAEQATSQESQASGEEGVADSIKAATTETLASTASTVSGAAQSAASAFTRSERGGQDREPRRTHQVADPKPTIYIGNLFFDVTENDLVKELARFGTIIKCRLMRDSRGLSKG